MISRLVFLILFLNGFISVAQPIRAYFNQSVDNSVSTITDAQTSAALDDTIKKFIDQSLSTLDIAVWDNGSTVITGAINDAYSRGVQVRYITSSNALNSSLSGLNSNIPVLERSSGLSSNVMHNKFIIVDEQQILTGSMNFGNGSIFDDYNNIVILEDPGLATTYTLEFEEMWGGSGSQPNLTNSKFGPDKTNNTLHSFNIGGSIVESYFSPTDNTTSEIVNAINSADFELDIAMFTFINNDIGDAVIAAKNRGVYVRCIIENVNYLGSEYNGLVSAGIAVLSHASVQYDFHHKYCIIDAQHPGSDPQVVTGSHNWTNSAEQEYDENTLILHDHTLAQQFTEEFFKRWTELGGADLVEEAANNSFYIYPNPVRDQFSLHGNLSDLSEIRILSSEGKILNTFSGKNLLESTFNPILSPGVYYLELEFDKGCQSLKLIVQ